MIFITITKNIIIAINVLLLGYYFAQIVKSFFFKCDFLSNDSDQFNQKKKLSYVIRIKVKS